MGGSQGEGQSLPGLNPAPSLQAPAWELSGAASIDVPGSTAVAGTVRTVLLENLNQIPIQIPVLCWGADAGSSGSWAHWVCRCRSPRHRGSVGAFGKGTPASFWAPRPPGLPREHSCGVGASARRDHPMTSGCCWDPPLLSSLLSFCTWEPSREPPGWAHLALLNAATREPGSDAQGAGSQRCKYT